ncbi:MAG: hypothetical protein WCJ58_03360 [bacterium]
MNQNKNKTKIKEDTILVKLNSSKSRINFSELNKIAQKINIYTELENKWKLKRASEIY